MRKAYLALASAVFGGALVAGYGCGGATDTNFGPPGGLEGKMPPNPLETDSGMKAGTDSGAKDAGKKCVFKKPPDSGTPPMDSGMATDGAAADGAPADGGGATDTGAAADTGSGGSEGGGSSDGCSVSWKKDIFPNMTEAGQWQCASNNGCHGGGFTTPAMYDDATMTYDSLVDYMLTLPSGKTEAFLVPCQMDTAKSGLLCTLQGSSCGAQMPLTTNGATPPTATQIKMIETWIKCGALND